MKYIKSNVTHWYYPKDYPDTNPVVTYIVVLDKKHGILQYHIGVLPQNPVARERVWCWSYLPDLAYDGEEE